MKAATKKRPGVRAGAQASAAPVEIDGGEIYRGWRVVLDHTPLPKSRPVFRVYHPPQVPAKLREEKAWAFLRNVRVALEKGTTEGGWELELVKG